MVIEHTDSIGRYFRFEHNGDAWSVSVIGDNFSIAGKMAEARDWQGHLITAGKALYRIGAGARLYTMTVQDELTLEVDHLGFLEQTGRHASRIRKSRKRIEWLQRLLESDAEFMDPQWEQGCNAKEAS